MRFFLILLVLIIGNVGYSQQLKQIQKGTANNQIPVTNGTQYTQVYRDALPYILDTLGIRDSIAVLSVSTPDSIYISGDSIKLRDGSGSVDVSDLVNVADSTIVQNSYGTIITESPANNFNVKVDSSLFATTYDITQKQNVITGTSGQTLRFDGTNTLIANSLLYNVGNQIGIGTITPTASYILDVAGNTKVRDGFLTVDNTVFINAATTLNMYNSANTGIFHSYQDGATSTDNIVYKGQYKTFTIGYNAGAGQSYANVANKKLHVNGAVSIGDGVSSTSVAANSLLVQGSATIQDRTGTASTLGGFDANGKLVGVTYGSGLSLSGNQLSTTGINGVENQIAWFNSTNTITSSSAIFRNENGLNTSENFDINTTGGFKGLRRIMSGLNHGVTNKLPTDMAWGFTDYSSTAHPNMYLVGVGKTSVPVMSFDLIRLDNPTSTYLNFELGYKSGISTVAADPSSSLFRISTSGQTKFNIFGNGDIRSYGALYNSSGSSGITGQALISQGSGAWTWSNVVSGSGVATRVAFWDGASSLSSNANLYWNNANSRLGIGTSSPNQSLHVAGSAQINSYLYGGDGQILVGQDGAAYYICAGSTAVTKPIYLGTSSTTFMRLPFLSGSGNRMVIANSTGDLSTQAIPTTPETWFDFGTKIQSWNSTGGFGSGKDVGIGIDPSQDFDLNGNARLRGAIYNSSNSAGTTGQVLTSQGTGSWIWSTVDQSTTNELQTISTSGTAGNITLSNGGGTLNLNVNDADASTTNELQTISTSGTAGNITLSNGGGTLNLNVNDADASTTNELQNLSLSGQSLGISSGTGVTLPIVDVVAGSGTSVSKVSGVATVSLSTILGQLSVDGNNSLSVTTSYTKLPFTSQAWNGTTTSTSTYDIQVPSDGFYELSFSGNFTENSASKIYGAFFINSTEQLRSRISSVALGTTDPINLSTSGIFLLSANDYISFRVKDTYVSNTLTYYSPTLSVKKL